jgi:hypothetical protein
VMTQVLPLARITCHRAAEAGCQTIIRPAL